MPSPYFYDRSDSHVDGANGHGPSNLYGLHVEPLRDRSRGREHGPSAYSSLGLLGGVSR